MSGGTFRARRDERMVLLIIKGPAEVYGAMQILSVGRSRAWSKGVV